MGAETKDGAEIFIPYVTVKETPSFRWAEHEPEPEYSSRKVVKLSFFILSKNCILSVLYCFIELPFNLLTPPWK